MTGLCTIHNTKMFESTFQPGSFYHYIDGDKANGSCRGEGMGKAVRNGRANGDGTPLSSSTPDQKVWDEKDRQSLAQTAMKGACEVVAAMIGAGFPDGTNTNSIEAWKQIAKDMANENYRELKRMKAEV